MKKFKKLGMMLAIMIMAFSLSGCCGYVMELSTDDNWSFDLVRKFGYDTAISPGSGLEIDGKTYSSQMVKLDQGITIFNGGVEEYSTLNDALYGNVFGNMVNLGHISVKYDVGDTTTLDYQPNICLDINSGLDAEGLYEKYSSAINKYVGSSVVSQYKNGDAATRERIEDQWMPRVKMIFNFATNVVAQAGEEWVDISGHRAEIDIGQMMRDGGGRVILFATDGDSTMDITHLFDESGKTPEQKPPVEKPAEKKFSDVDDNAWYAEAVKYCVKKGVMSGYDSGKFGPNDPITVAQMCQIMFNNGLMEDEYKYDIIPVDHWAAIPIGWCTYNNLVIDADVEDANGNITKNSLNAPMTRQQAIAAMSRLASYKGEKPDNSKNPSIPDLMSIDFKYRDQIKLAYKFGITNGVDDSGTFRPMTNVTRAQVCQMIYSMGW